MYGVQFQNKSNMEAVGVFYNVVSIMVCYVFYNPEHRFYI
jgi:hypothetical protein